MVKVETMPITRFDSSDRTDSDIVIVRLSSQILGSR